MKPKHFSQKHFMVVCVMIVCQPLINLLPVKKNILFREWAESLLKASTIIGKTDTGYSRNSIMFPGDTVAVAAAGIVLMGLRSDMRSSLPGHLLQYQYICGLWA